jgi:hypothetical protein
MTTFGNPSDSPLKERFPNMTRTGYVPPVETFERTVNSWV